MKAFIVGTIARQVDGEYVFVRLEKGYEEANKADVMVKTLSKTFTENIYAAGQQIPCLCERGVFEVDIEPKEDNEQKP